MSRHMSDCDRCHRWMTCEWRKDVYFGNPAGAMVCKSCLSSILAARRESERMAGKTYAFGESL